MDTAYNYSHYATSTAYKSLVVAMHVNEKAYHKILVAFKFIATINLLGQAWASPTLVGSLVPWTMYKNIEINV